jgi:hypothetical protein
VSVDEAAQLAQLRVDAPRHGTAEERVLLLVGGGGALVAGLQLQQRRPLLRLVAVRWERRDHATREVVERVAGQPAGGCLKGAVELGPGLLHDHHPRLLLRGVLLLPLGGRGEDRLPQPATLHAREGVIDDNCAPAAVQEELDTEQADVHEVFDDEVAQQDVALADGAGGQRGEVVAVAQPPLADVVAVDVAGEAHELPAGIPYLGECLPLDALHTCQEGILILAERLRTLGDSGCLLCTDIASE